MVHFMVIPAAGDIADQDRIWWDQVDLDEFRFNERKRRVQLCGLGGSGSALLELEDLEDEEVEEHKAFFDGPARRAGQEDDGSHAEASTRKAGLGDIERYSIIPEAEACGAPPFPMGMSSPKPKDKQHNASALCRGDNVQVAPTSFFPSAPESAESAAQRSAKLDFSEPPPKLVAVKISYPLPFGTVPFLPPTKPGPPTLLQSPSSVGDNSQMKTPPSPASPPPRSFLQPFLGAPLRYHGTIETLHLVKAESAFGGPNRLRSAES